jgi:hypothetical protein
VGDEARTRELERGFRRAGLPTLIRGYSARQAFAKALPILTLVFVLEILNALNLRFDFLPNVGFLAGGIVLALGAVGLLNVARGQPFLSAPRRIGIPEMLIFLLAPSILPLIFGGQRTSAAVTMLVNATLLGTVYLVFGFGALSILAWAGRRFISLFAASLSVLVRALSLLLFFLLVIFFTTETWQIWTVPAVPKFMAAGGLFVRDLEREAALHGGELGRPQRVNVALVVFLSQFLQVVFVAAAVWLFFVVFGSLLVDAGVRAAWLGDPGTALWSVPFFGETVVVITVELLRVATGMACFAALYYAVATQIDAAYRDEVVEQLGEQLRETFAEREEYLSLVRATARASGPGPPAEG